MSKIKWKHYIGFVGVTIFAAIFAVLSLGSGLDRSITCLLEEMAIAIVLAVSLSMVVGFLGELSLGHAGFMCLGAYIGGKASVLLQPMMGDVPALVVSLLIGGIVAAIFGVIIALPALRLRGDYLAIVTLAFGEIIRSVFMNSGKESFGGNLGLSTPRFDRNYLFIIAFVVVLLCLMVAQNLIRSKHGRAITSIRDNEIAAKATGINVTKYKLIVFAISSFFAGLAGVLFSYSQYTVQSSTFDYNYSIEILVMVVLGGMGSINGSIIAAAAISFLEWWLQSELTGNMAVLKDLVYALILILLVVYNNAPALHDFREKFNIRRLFASRGKHNPAHVKDDEAKWHRVPTKIKVDEVLSLDLQATSPYTPDKSKKED
ncbi:MAG: branched-chain amino acid ABC transporter permease [Oscillospiraceae bacterium]|nr:branched-chain amino acid ABC transporter permease [Oscillospiraceae bacterium]